MFFEGRKTSQFNGLPVRRPQVLRFANISNLDVGQICGRWRAIQSLLQGLHLAAVGVLGLLMGVGGCWRAHREPTWVSRFPRRGISPAVSVSLKEYCGTVVLYILQPHTTIIALASKSLVKVRNFCNFGEWHSSLHKSGLQGGFKSRITWESPVACILSNFAHSGQLLVFANQWVQCPQ